MRGGNEEIPYVKAVGLYYLEEGNYSVMSLSVCIYATGPMFMIRSSSKRYTMAWFS